MQDEEEGRKEWEKWERLVMYMAGGFGRDGRGALRLVGESGE